MAKLELAFLAYCGGLLMNLVTKTLNIFGSSLHFQIFILKDQNLTFFTCKLNYDTYLPTTTCVRIKISKQLLFFTLDFSFRSYAFYVFACMHKKRNSLDGHVTHCVNNFIFRVANPRYMNIETSCAFNRCSKSGGK